MEQKSIYQHSSMNIRVLLIFLSIAMVAVGIYLTNHYFDVKYPTGLSGGSMCDFNSFFNCDAATHSKAATLFGVPISLFGLLLGMLLLMGLPIKSARYEATLHHILYINAIGCFILLVYSLVALGSLCPFCTVYYILSFSVLGLFFKKSTLKKPDPAFLAGFGCVFMVAGGLTLYYIGHKEKGQTALASSLISQFDRYEKLSNPTVLSPHKIAQATEDFAKAPIQLIIFSDFQCPACKVLSSMMPAISKRYEGKINILYYFFPLDNACNAEMKAAIHPLACTLAYMAQCSGSNFHKVHDDIFEHQESLSFEWIKKYSKSIAVEACMNLSETKQKVVELLEQGKQINLRSTPTLLLNGVKIEGSLPLNQFFILMDELVKRNAQNVQIR